MQTPMALQDRAILSLEQPVPVQPLTGVTQLTESAYENTAARIPQHRKCCRKGT